MQFYAILSLFFCVFSMFLLFFGKERLGELSFAGSLILLMISLSLSAWEIKISVDALDLQLSECIGDACLVEDKNISNTTERPKLKL